MSYDLFRMSLFIFLFIELYGIVLPNKGGTHFDIICYGIIF